MIPCKVEYHHTAIIVRFNDGKSLLIQNENDQCAFAVDSGLISAPRNWDGHADKLGKVWTNCDLEDITQCSEEYHNMADYKENC